MRARKPLGLPTRSAPRGFLARLADLTSRRRGSTVLVWFVLLPPVIVLGARYAGEFAADYSTPGSESKAAADLISERIMQLLGGANWWIPAWLNRLLPRLDVAVPATSPPASTSERRAASAATRAARHWQTGDHAQSRGPSEATG
jgi:hypothetical protein